MVPGGFVEHAVDKGRVLDTSDKVGQEPDLVGGDEADAVGDPLGDLRPTDQLHEVVAALLEVVELVP